MACVAGEIRTACPHPFCCPRSWLSLGVLASSLSASFGVWWVEGAPTRPLGRRVCGRHCVWSRISQPGQPGASSARLILSCRCRACQPFTLFVVTLIRRCASHLSIYLLLNSCVIRHASASPTVAIASRISWPHFSVICCLRVACIPRVRSQLSVRLVACCLNAVLRLSSSCASLALRGLCALLCLTLA